MLLAGWRKGRAVSGTRVIRQGTPSPYFSATARAAYFTSQFRCRARQRMWPSSQDRKWLAVIYTAGGQGFVAVFRIDAYGDLTPVATSSAIGVAAFNGVAISQ